MLYHKPTDQKLTNQLSDKHGLESEETYREEQPELRESPEQGDREDRQHYLNEQTAPPHGIEQAPRRDDGHLQSAQ